MKCFCSLAMTFCALSTGVGADWASWRGPDHNGISRETGLVESWDPESGTNVLWESPIGGRAA